MEFMILDAIQTLRTPWLDGVMVFVSSLGNSGAVWIVLAAVLLALPKYRRLGVVVACALALDLVVCNLFLKPLIARPRPCDMNTAMDYLIARRMAGPFLGAHGGVFCCSFGALVRGQPAVDSLRDSGCADPRFPRFTFMCISPQMCWAARRVALCGALGAFAVRRVAVRRDGT